MKKYSLEKFKEKKKNKRMTKYSLVVLAAVVILIIVSLYIANKGFRSFIDTYILRREVRESNSQSIAVDTDSLALIYAYDNNIVTYSGGKLTFYDKHGKEISNTELTFSKPIANSKGKYLVIGDSGAQKVCLITKNDIVWQADVEGKISKVAVNENGYVVVSTTGTTYESMVMLYDQKGNIQFTKYISTYVLDAQISADNKYIALAQADNSKISPSTKVELISIDKAKSNSEEATLNTYYGESGDVLTGIKFQDKDKVLCAFDSYIVRLTEKEANKIYEYSDLTAYIDVNMNKEFVRIDKEESSVFKSDYRLKITNNNKTEKTFIIEGSLKSIVAKDKTIALNLGNEVVFLDSNAWVMKKYTSSQDIKNVIVSDKLGLIIYGDKIDIVRL